MPTTISESDKTLIQESGLFTGIGLEAFEGLLSRCSITHLAAGSTLMRSGQENDRLYLVLSGALHVYLDDDTDNHYLTLRSGEVVGEMSIIDGGSTSAMVIASQNSRLLALDQEDVWSLVRASSGLAKNLMYILARRMRNDNRAIIHGMKLRKELEVAANVDGLTGIYNRRWLNDHFPRQVERSRKNGEPLALLLADLDHFKQLNDAHGHLAGDDVLRGIARLFSLNLRPGDLLARFGGEEFAILLPAADLSQAVQIGERLRNLAGTTPVESDACPAPLTVTLSVGIAAMNDQDDLASLLTRADEALYQAKNQGRNRVVTAG